MRLGKVWVEKLGRKVESGDFWAGVKEGLLWCSVRLSPFLQHSEECCEDFNNFVELNLPHTLTVLGI